MPVKAVVLERGANYLCKTGRCQLSDNEMVCINIKNILSSSHDYYKDFGVRQLNNYDNYVIIL